MSVAMQVKSSEPIDVFQPQLNRQPLLKVDTQWVEIRFRKPILEGFDFEAYFPNPRDIKTLANEQRLFRRKFSSGFDDVELPPDND